jgi:hypothetical protein
MMFCSECLNGRDGFGEIVMAGCIILKQISGNCYLEIVIRSHVAYDGPLSI